jgi:2-oxoglutarate ferredoxin oxidoreductase subunit beta
VARSFSGDKGQLVPLIKAAMAHNGPAFIDVISPCVAFNNHAGSTKSFDFVREHNDAVNRIDFIEGRAEITVDYPPGTVQDVEQHDGSIIRLHKIEGAYDPTNRVVAMDYLQQHHEKGEVVTGLLYLDPNPRDLHGFLRTVDVPLNRLNAKELCPGSKALEALNDEYR